MKKLLSIGLCLAVILSFTLTDGIVTVFAEQNAGTSWEDAVSQSMALFQDGGGYYTGTSHPTGFTQNTWEGMDKAFQLGENDSAPTIDVSLARPSFCSSATYMLLLKSISLWDSSHAVPRNAWVNLKPYTLPVLDKDGNSVPRQNDGEGCWGRANANGPGLAVLVKELGAGENYYVGNQSEYSSKDDYYAAWNQAQKGDFLKIFWNSGIGCDNNNPDGDEAGHMVLFLGRDIAYDANGNRDDIIHYWSSNGSHTDINAGYSAAQCNASKIYRAVLTRITKPQNFNNADKIDRFNVNQWLSDLNGQKHGTVEEMKTACGINENPQPSNSSSPSSTTSSTPSSSTASSSSSKSSSVIPSSSVDSSSTVTVSNASTGISVTGSILPSDVNLQVEPITDQSNAQFIAAQKALGNDQIAALFDISLLRNNTRYEPSGKVTVSMPLPASLAGKSGVVIAHMKDDGSIIYITPTIQNGIITFQTDSFSKYAIVLTSNTAKTDTPSTGDHPFLPIVLSLIAMFSVSGLIVMRRFAPKHSSGSR